MTPPFNARAVTAEIDRILRFVLPDTEVERMLNDAVRAVRRCRNLSIVRRPGVLSSLSGALRLTTDRTVREELSALIARIGEPR